GPPKEVWLPPRLRDRLEQKDYDAPEYKSSPVGLIVFIVILVAAGCGVWALVAANKAKEAKAAAAAKAEAARVAKVEADSLAKIRVADSLLTAARAESLAAFMKLPKWRQDQLHGIATPGIGNPEEKGSFVIDAGEFLIEDPAKAAADAIRAKTKLAVNVVPVGTGGDQTFHVYIGKFSSRGAAQQSADDLINKGIAKQANVISAPK